MASVVLSVSTAVFGSVVLLPPLYSLFSYVYIVSLHRSTIKQHLLSPSSYALITGATAGLGKSFARELLKLGFNVVIHGRNAEKLSAVREELNALGTGREVRVLVADAEKPFDAEEVDRQLEGLEITVLLNNVGGTTPPGVSLDRQSLDYINGVLSVNALFPLLLTRHLLPRLRSLPGPALVVCIGSLASEVAAPYLALYSASKAFLDMFSRSVDVQERLLLKSQVRVQFFQTGRVVTSGGPGHERGEGWDCPTADVYARACLHVVGCGRRKICPWWGHAISAFGIGLAGGERADAAMAASEVAKAKKGD